MANAQPTTKKGVGFFGFFLGALDTAFGFEFYPDAPDNLDPLGPEEGKWAHHWSAIQTRVITRQTRYF